MIKWRQNAYNGKMLFLPCLNACYDKLSFGLCLNACSDKWRIQWQSFRSLFNRTMEVWGNYLYILFSWLLRCLAGKNTNITLAYLINLSIWLYAYTKIHDKIFSIDMTNISLWVIEKCGCRHPHYQFRACFITCICQNESTFLRNIHFLLPITCPLNCRDALTRCQYKPYIIYIPWIST